MTNSRFWLDVHGSWRVAFGQNGDVVLTDDPFMRLYRNDGGAYEIATGQDFNTVTHSELETSCYKAISDSRIFVQDGPGSTLVFDRRFNYLGQREYDGHLCGILYPDTLVYAKQRGFVDWILVHTGEKQGILRPTDGRTWDRGLSVCICRAQYIVVVESSTTSMDVFSVRGRH